MGRSVVDPDIDVRNPAEVDWAKSFRVKPREDVFVVDRTAAAPLDPATDGGFSSSVEYATPLSLSAATFPRCRKCRAGKDFSLPEIDKRSI